MVLQNFMFLDENSGATSEECTLTTGYDGNMSLQVEAIGGSVVNLRVQVTTLKNGEWQDMAVISMKDYTVAESITESGLYSFGVGGARSVRVVNNRSAGSVIVYGRLMA